MAKLRINSIATIGNTGESSQQRFLDSINLDLLLAGLVRKKKEIIKKVGS